MAKVRSEGTECYEYNGLESPHDQIDPERFREIQRKGIEVNLSTFEFLADFHRV